jgi:hypothetical protein
MEIPVFDLFTLCSDIHRVAPGNHVQFCGDSLILNDKRVTITGNLATYGGTKLKFSTALELLRQLRFDNILVCSKEELLFMTSRPSSHSHKLRKPFVPRDPNSKRTKKFLERPATKYNSLKRGQSENQSKVE